MTTTTDTCSRHIRARRRGGQLQTASSQLIEIRRPAQPSPPKAPVPDAHHRRYAVGRSSQVAVGTFSCPYNTRRRHSALGMRPPVDYEEATEERSSPINPGPSSASVKAERCWALKAPGRDGRSALASGGQPPSLGALQRFRATDSGRKRQSIRSDTDTADRQRPVVDPRPSAWLSDFRELIPSSAWRSRS